jgi:hypothetical protein
MQQITIRNMKLNIASAIVLLSGLASVSGSALSKRAQSFQAKDISIADGTFSTALLAPNTSGEADCNYCPFGYCCPDGYCYCTNTGICYDPAC